MRNGHLRASDADRDLVAERLRTAAAEGRIATDELDERMGATLAARTYAELEAVIADLPGTQPERRRSATPARSVAGVAIALALVVPVLMAAIFVLTSVFAVWMLWAAVTLIGTLRPVPGAASGSDDPGERRASDEPC